MEPHSPKSPRFSDTPPGSPKSCMKGSRKITFDSSTGKPTYVDVGVSVSASTTTSVTGSSSSPVHSPSKRSPKSVQIRMVDAGTSSNSGGVRNTSFELQDTSSAAGPSSKAPPPPEIQFQFELTEHFDQSTPPPNCTSNGNYDFDQQQETTPSSTSTSGADAIDYEELRKDPQLIEIANKFVNDIIEKAKVEAANRQKIEEMGGRGGTAGTTSTDRDSFSNEIARGAGTWLRRAHGTVSKWFTTICVRAQNIRADLK